MRTVILIASLVWLAWAPASHAEGRLVLSGIGTGHPRVTITLGPGSELTRCPNGSEALMRCFIVDTANSEAVIADIAEQIQGQGFVAASPRPGATPGLRVFTPAETRVRCPHIVMIVPNAESRFAVEPPAQDQLFYLISYATDLHCLAEAPRQ